MVSPGVVRVLDEGLVTLQRLDELDEPLTFTRLDGFVEKAGFSNLAEPMVLKIWFSNGTDDATDGPVEIKWYRKDY